MHTKVLAISVSRWVVACVCLLLCWGLVGSVEAQPAFPGTPEGRGFNLRVYPSDVWTPRVGPGIGVGLVAHNLARRHDQWLITAAPALREQVMTASFASANPHRADRYALVNVRGLHTDADWIGPPDQRTVLKRSALRVRVRGGQHLLSHRILLQPHLTLSHHRIGAVDRPSSGSPSVGPFLPTAGRTQTGARVGVDLQLDLLDRPQVPTQGVLLQGTWDRYVPVEGADLQFDQFDLDAYGYVPLGGAHRLATRASLTLTDARSTVPIPAYMLPTLGGSVVPGWSRGRFVGRDRLLASALYRFPLLHYDNLVTVGGHAGVHLAGMYNHLGDQFAADVSFTNDSFEDDVAMNDGPRPLLPSASVGLRFAMPRRDHVLFELALGISPEGVSAVRFSFARALQALRPSHHTSAHPR